MHHPYKTRAVPFSEAGASNYREFTAQLKPGDTFDIFFAGSGKKTWRYTGEETVEWILYFQEGYQQRSWNPKVVAHREEVVIPNCYA